MKRKIFSVILVIVMVIAFGTFAIGSGSKDSGTSTGGSKTDENAIGSKNNPLTVGNTMESNGLKIALNDVDLNYTGYDKRYGLHEPQPGMKYISVSVTFQNDSQKDAYVSIYDFDCYADGSTCQQEYGLEPDINVSNNFINTNLSAGRNVSFTTYYSVPEGAQSIELEYEANIWTNKKAYIKLQ